ncbi:MAG: secretin N-terminal domain-containing protein, partial [Planctomycetota bacterium]
AAEGDAPDPRAPLVDADLATNSLLVRATAMQIEQIKSFLGQLGETGEATLAERSGVRLLPYSGPAAASALEQVRGFWPSLRDNRIRVVAPTGGIRTFRPSSEDEAPQNEASGFDGFDDDSLFDPFFEPLLEDPQPREPAARPRSTKAPGRVTTRFAVQRESTAGGEPAEIVVAPGPGGLIIASSDLDALDQFEQLVRTAAGSATGGRELAVFYLRFAEAGAAAETLGKVFGAGSGGGGGDLIGGIAEAAMGDLGGGLMGDLLGFGGGGGGGDSLGGGFTSSSVDIVPDARLNALIVYAQPEDLQTVDQLLRILDQRTGPEVVEAGGKPRLIAVQNNSAAAVASVVKEVYKNRLESSGSGNGGGRQPNPEELIRALRGRGGQGGGAGGSGPEPSKMTIGVDERSNSLVVKAPDPLFEEVRLLVKQLDEEGLETPRLTRVVSLEHSNAEAVKEALESLLGEEAVTTVSSQQQQNRSRNSSSSQGGNNSADRAAEFQRRLEFFQRLRNAQPGGGRGGPPGGGGRPGGGPGRGGGRPGGR